MASSSRGRKKPKVQVGAGSGRMDAAWEHLQPMGFSKKEITDTINSLLMAYGNDGWFFLEEDSYRVVIDALTGEHNEKEEKEEMSPQQREDHRSDDSPQELDPPSHSNQEEEETDERDDFSRINVIPHDSELFKIIPPGRSRPPCWGYLVETDDDSASDRDA